MKETTEQTILETLAKQRAFFSSHKTKEIGFRIRQLKVLKKSIIEHESKIEEALWKDLHKSKEEAYLTEISIVLSEIDHHIFNLKNWAQPKKVSTPLYLKPSSSKIYYDPLGVALIIAPWNYPFQLLINSLVGAISGGCCSILKPSPDTPTIAKVMEEMISQNFEEGYVKILQGGRETNTILLQQKFDIIFFTGSSRVGKVIMRAAAEHLTPVVLELGGKSPCIVDKTANLDVAAKRIIWGKLINAGQTCIAPDYVFAHASIKDELLAKIVQQIEKLHGKNPQESKFYPRIVNQQAHDRLMELMSEGTIYTGGQSDLADLYIAPTIIDGIQKDSPIMQEEIFGPILPVLTFQKIDEAINYINKNEKPLALYYFGKRSKSIDVLVQTSSGGGCINDTLLHIANHNLPFGGVGNSGLGNYHGRESFLAFSHRRAILSSPTWIDLPFKYPPFKYFKWIRKIL